MGWSRLGVTATPQEETAWPVLSAVQVAAFVASLMEGDTAEASLEVMAVVQGSVSVDIYYAHRRIKEK
jgi:hypothetical protein